MLGTKHAVRLHRLCIGRCASQWLPLTLDARLKSGERSFTGYGPKLQGRKKAKARALTVDLADVPQGAVPLGPLPDRPDLSEGYPTVIQQARNNMRKFNHCVLLTRVGSFYELYFEHAEEYGSLLGLKVASRRTSNGPVAMAGFPFFQLDRFLKTLVQDHGKHVAISEEIPNDASQKVKSGGLLFDRQVLRVVTPGTLIDEQFLNPYEHNYLLAIYFRDSSAPAQEQYMQKNPQDTPTNVGLSWLDLSSGDFFTQSTTIESLASDVARIAPREILLPKTLQDMGSDGLLSSIQDGGHRITYWKQQEEQSSVHDWSQMFDDGVAATELERHTVEETISTNFLLQYVKEQIPRLRFRLQVPIRRNTNEYMTIDKNSLRGLEVLHTLRDGNYKGSLLQTVRRTSTESGARLLAQRLTSPSMSLEIINERLDLVDTFMVKPTLLEEVTDLLRQSFDTLRLVQKFSIGRGDADDLLRLAKTIAIAQDLVEVLVRHSSPAGTSLQQLIERFNQEGPAQIALQISQAIDEEGLSLRQRNQDFEAAEAAGMAREVLASRAKESDNVGDLQKQLSAKRFSKNTGSFEEKTMQEDVWIMRRNASSILRKLHEALDSLVAERLKLTSKLEVQLGVTTLTLKLTPGLGHICHIKGKDVRADLSVLENARTVGSSKSTRSFYLPEWTRLGTQIENAKLRIRGEEQSIFASLRDGVIENLVHLRRNAAVLDDIDVACSFAQLALEYDLKRPLLNHSCEHKILGGRHIMVDAGLTESGRHFTPNDCSLDEKERIWLVTGPNMAGKSTFLRQTALAIILAQTGSFVPAEYAEVGLVDQIFSRVGSADNLFQDQSTFMVEMIETAQILRQATRRSFVIMDEVGRGTTPQDGIAIGFAVLNYLQETNKCRVLFATHFHVLADMTQNFQGLACYCTDVKEGKDGSFRFDHRLKKGVNRESHALKVAQLAGLPEKAIEVATDTLRLLQEGEKAG